MPYSAQLGCMVQLVLLCQMSHKNTTAEARYNPKKGGERDRSSVLIRKIFASRRLALFLLLGLTHYKH